MGAPTCADLEYYAERAQAGIREALAIHCGHEKGDHTTPHLAWMPPDQVRSWGSAASKAAASWRSAGNVLAQKAAAARKAQGGGGFTVRALLEMVGTVDKTLDGDGRQEEAARK